MDELRSILECRATPIPVQPDPRANNQGLRLKYNVCYIVAGVLLEGEKILLIQEAKPSCHGRWYLPAGRMEPNETIIEAVKREVLEEAGLIFEPEAILAVEYQHYWVRITLAGRAIGGGLKTTEQADRESLQAKWFTKNEFNGVSLRAKDIIPLIDLGRRRAERTRFTGLPVELGHVSSSLRLIIIHRNVVLTQSKGQGSTSFPSSGLSEGDMDRVIKSCGYKGSYKVCGVISLEHLGHPHGEYDGMCASVLIETSSQELDHTSYSWSSIEEKLEVKLKHDLENLAQLIYL